MLYNVRKHLHKNTKVILRLTPTVLIYFHPFLFLYGTVACGSERSLWRHLDLDSDPAPPFTYYIVQKSFLSSLNLNFLIY